MNKVAQAFARGKAFIGYLMAGDPGLDKTRDYILAMQKAGADLIEIGIPFSDPIAEGEVIQEANIRALSAGTTPDGIFGMLEGMRDEVRVSLVFLTYLNPVFIYGYEAFFRRCGECGVSGIIIPDLPFEEQGELQAIAEQNGVEVITLIAPTSQDRIARIAQRANGFLYLVSSMGVTGVRDSISTDIPALVEKIRPHTKTPIAVGFGISTTQQAAEYSKSADGVIVGSAIVRLIAEHGEEAEEAISSYVREMKQAVQA